MVLKDVFISAILWSAWYHHLHHRSQVLKSTADVEGGRALYDFYSTVSDSGAHNFLRLRETVLLRKEARKMFVQANTKISGMYCAQVNSIRGALRSC